MINIRNIKKFYRHRLVLDIPELDIERGSLCVIVGVNGAGKTTLLRLIDGLEKPSSGHIHVSVGRLDMTCCFQKPFMFFGTVKENICYGLKARKQGVDNGILNGVVKSFGLDGIIERNSKELSAGEIQRVSIARAVILKPKLLLLDEPVANIDPESTSKIEEAILELNEDGTTIIMTTHIREHAYRLSSNVLRLEGGRIVSPEVL